MSTSLAGRSFLTLKDYSADEIVSLIELAIDLKEQSASGTRAQRLAGYSLAMIFEKRSTRTRCAFETAFGEEGGHPVFLGSQDIHLGVKEDLEDTARVLGRMFDAIQFRGFRQSVVQTLAEYSGVPVYNGLTDDFHPTQALADLMALQEEFGEVTGRKIVYLGDGRNNVARSLLITCAKLGTSITIGAPNELQPDNATLEYCKPFAEKSGATIAVEPDPRTAVRDADALYTDVWASMGEEAEKQNRERLLSPYQITTDLMSATGKDTTIFLHCLPAVKGEETTAEVFESHASRVFEEAENRKHTIKALILATLDLA